MIHLQFRGEGQHRRQKLPPTTYIIASCCPGNKLWIQGGKRKSNEWAGPHHPLLRVVV